MNRAEDRDVYMAASVIQDLAGLRVSLQCEYTSCRASGQKERTSRKPGGGGLAGWLPLLRSNCIRGCVLIAAVCGSCPAGAQTGVSAPYAVPAKSAGVLRGVDFGHAQVIDSQLTSLYQACDQNRERGGCATDPAGNHAVLRFGDGAVFFDAKMAIDADGSALSKRAEHPNQPETAFRYPDTQGSLDAERVPYVVMPLGDFRRESGISLGDLAAVIKDGRLQFAIVGDLGPRTHIGEASMKLHMQFGRDICTAFDAEHNCSAFTDTSIDAPVLYFFFPDTRKLIYDGLTASNINERIATVGRQVWSAFLTQQREQREGN